MQEKLGEQYEILEEGLRSRTTDLDDDDPNFPNRSGKEYLLPCLESQYPLDLVILWLGTNDLKTKFNRTPAQVAEALAGLVDVIQHSGQPAPKTLLVSPPIIKEEALKAGSQFAGAGEKSKQLAHFIEKIAQQKACSFVDLAQFVEPGNADGVHLELDVQETVAEVMLREIRKIVPYSL